MKKSTNTVEHERKYVDFLIKRLQSKNFRDNVSKEEFEKTQKKYDKAKLKLRMLEKGFLK